MNSVARMENIKRLNIFCSVFIGTDYNMEGKEDFNYGYGY